MELNRGKGGRGRGTGVSTVVVGRPPEDVTGGSSEDVEDEVKRVVDFGLHKKFTFNPIEKTDFERL